MLDNRIRPIKNVIRSRQSNEKKQDFFHDPARLRNTVRLLIISYSR